MFQKHVLDKVAVHKCNYDLNLQLRFQLQLQNYFVRNLCSISKANLILDTAKISLAPMSI